MPSLTMIGAYCSCLIEVSFDLLDLFARPTNAATAATTFFDVAVCLLGFLFGLVALGLGLVPRSGDRGGDTLSCVLWLLEPIVVVVLIRFEGR